MAGRRPLIVLSGTTDKLDKKALAFALDFTPPPFCTVSTLAAECRPQGVFGTVFLELLGVVMMMRAFLILLTLGSSALMYNTADARIMADPFCWWESYSVPIELGGGYFMLEFCTVGGGSPEYVGCMDFPVFGAPACP